MPKVDAFERFEIRIAGFDNGHDVCYRNKIVIAKADPVKGD